MPIIDYIDEWTTLPSQVANTYKTNNQTVPSVAVLKDGSTIVVWNSYGQDGSQNGVYAQRFDIDGSKFGSEFRVNTGTYGSQEFPAVTALSNGGFLVAWHSYAASTTDSYDILAQRFDASGTAVGGEFTLNTSSSSVQIYPSVAALPDGGFVAVWESSIRTDPNSPYSKEVIGQRFDANGLPVGAEFQVNTTTDGEQTEVDVAVLANGETVVTWFDDVQGVMARVYDATGMSLTDEWVVDTRWVSAPYPSVAALSNGDFVIAFDSPDGSSNSNSRRGIAVQRFDPTGNSVGSEFVVNTTIAGVQKTTDIVGLADGGFVVSWESDAQQNGEVDIFAQRFDPEGQAIGNEFVVNGPSPTGGQLWVAIAARKDGGFVAAYQSQTPQYGFDIYTRFVGSNAGFENLYAPGGF